MTAASPLVRVKGVIKRFGRNTVLDGVDLDVAKGEVVVIIGASGSGKTTLLRCINLLETYDDGSITVDGTEIGYRDGAGGGRRRRDSRVPHVPALARASQSSGVAASPRLFQETTP